MIRHGTYIGEDKELQGETALLRSSAHVDKCLAQFDNIDKFGQHCDDYAFNWHTFNTSDFKVDEEPTW